MTSERLDFLEAALAKRGAKGTLRSLTVKSGLVDFASFDYLGFARSLLREDGSDDNARPSGSGGSRLLFGNSPEFIEVESLIAAFHHAPAALIFNSGYDANLGLFSALGVRGSSVVCDELAHASIRDGIRLGHARSLKFRHNDLDDLKKKLAQCTGERFVAVESVYSMEGDCAPLVELAALCRSSGAHLIVDEAHATGIFGTEGRGLVCQLGLEDQVFARLHTFGKALGCHGAAVVGPQILRDYLINFARSFIYSTALPPAAVETIRRAYLLLPQAAGAREALHGCIEGWKRLLRESGVPGVSFTASAIQSVPIPGPERARAISKNIERRGFDARAIVSPTVPEGSERLRVCLHSFNTEAEMRGLISAITEELA